MKTTDKLLLCAVQMLPTEKESNLYYDRQMKSLHAGKKNVYSDYEHLYLTSFREIKEGDWYIDDVNRIRQAITSDKAYWEVRKDYRRIEATTDSSLDNIYSNDESAKKSSLYNLYSLPLIPDSFVQAYVKTQGDIKEVSIEMAEESLVRNSEHYIEVGLKYKIKTREDNTVIIHRTKTYSEQEVRAMLNKANMNGYWLHYEEINGAGSSNENPIPIIKYVEQTLNK